MLLLLRFVKFLAAATLLAGTLGAVFSRAHEDRQRFAYWIAGPAFGVTWLAGFLLVHHLGFPLFTTWIVGALALSLFSLQVVLFVAGRDGRRNAVAATLALVPWVLTVALMVWKPGGVEP